MFVLEFLPYGKYSTAFEFTGNETMLFYGEGHKFFTIGRAGQFRHADFVSRSNTTIRAV